MAADCNLFSVAAGARGDCALPATCATGVLAVGDPMGGVIATGAPSGNTGGEGRAATSA